MAKFWHKTDEYKAHEQVFDHVRLIQQDQSDYVRKCRDLARFYSNRLEPGLHGVSNIYREGWDGVTENVIASVIDTATALIAKSRPKVSVLTENAEWNLQQTARKVEQYVLGLFDTLNVYDLMANIFRDSCIFGTGVVHAYVYEGEVKVERVLPTEIVVDEQTTRCNPKPLEMHRCRFVPKDVLKAKFPEKEEEIEGSSCGIYEEWYTHVEKNMVLIIESWRLPTKAGPGRYTMTVEGATLVDDQYTKDSFPFVVYRWSPPVTGYYGQGLAEPLIGYQVRINQLNDFIRKCQDLIAVPRVFVEAANRLLKTQLNNEIGAVTQYVGQPPTFFTPQALNAEIYQYKEQLKLSAFEFAGISKMAAQATRPEGIHAGVALRELSDNQSQRFSIQQARYEGAHVALAKLILGLVRPMGKKAPKAYLAKKFVETIDWPQVDFDKNKFVFRIQPASALGDTPAGRLQRVIEMAQYGVPIDPAVLTRLLAHPDIALEDNRMTSALEHAEWVVWKLGEGEYPAPDAFMDLVLTLDRVMAAYLDFVRLGAPENILQNMRDWILQAQSLLQPTPALDPAGGGMPLAGNVANEALPGVVDPTQADTAETLLSGLSAPPTTA